MTSVGDVIPICIRLWNRIPQDSAIKQCIWDCRKMVLCGESDLQIDVCVSRSVVQLFVTPWTVWTVACQSPLSIEFSRQEYWIRLPFPSPGNLPDPGIEPESPAMAGRILSCF